MNVRKADQLKIKIFADGADVKGIREAAANPLISGFYILAIVLLCVHLYHGLWSMFQSLGLSHPKYTPKLKKGAAIFAILIAIGNCSIPVAVMTGLVK